jgi:hypothetical protein
VSARLSEQGRKAQAECLRSAGYADDARLVEQGMVDYDPEWLETLAPDGGSRG